MGVAAPSLRTDLHARLQCRIIVHMAQHAYPRTQKRVQRMSFRNLLWGGGADVIWVYARGRWRSVGCVLGGQRRSFGCMLGGRWRSRGCALGGALEVMPVSVRGGGRWRSVRSHARVCIATLLKRLQAIILSISACTCVYRKASKTSADKYSRHMEVHVCASQSF